MRIPVVSVTRGDAEVLVDGAGAALQWGDSALPAEEQAMAARARGQEDAHPWSFATALGTRVTVHDAPNQACPAARRPHPRPAPPRRARRAARGG